jgi:DNA-binding NtrC family response regulator
MRSSPRILVVDDEDLVRYSIRQKLENENFTVVEAADGEEATKLFADCSLDMILLDYKLPDTDGLQILRKIRDDGEDIPVIMVTALGSAKDVVQAMKLGANNYIVKPFDMDELVIVVQNTLREANLADEAKLYREKARRELDTSSIVARSGTMLDLIELMKKYAESDPATILLQGESGTGKDVFAKAIHYHSRRAKQPFVNITCTALPANLLESELMGYEKGAFTDAKKSKKGLLELADGGTVFLDEVGDLAPSLQAKLLRFLEEKRFIRVGGTRDIQVDVRVIAATNRDLKKAVKEGRFREDFYYRLNVLEINIPPLRERREDIEPLVDHFIAIFNRTFRKEVKKASADAIRRLMEYDWPGNVRELKNIVERAVILSKNRVLGWEDFPLDLKGDNVDTGDSLFDLPRGGVDLEEMEKKLVRQAMERANGNQALAGRLLGLNRDQVHYRLKKFSLLDLISNPKGS